MFDTLRLCWRITDKQVIHWPFLPLRVQNIHTTRRYSHGTSRIQAFGLEVFRAMSGATLTCCCHLNNCEHGAI